MRIAVTGASGFIGGAAATALADDGHEVVGFGRRDAGWNHRGGEYRVWDLLAPPPADAAAFDAVVHCAGLADDAAPLSEALRVNVAGTARVRDAFAAARIVHVSSSSVYDMRSPSVWTAESRGPASTHLNAYSRSKALAERELAGTDAVILRPHAVYGEGDATLLPRIEAAVRRGRLPLPAGGRVLHALTHVDNLASAIRLALEGAPGTYNVTDASPVVLRDFITRALRARGHDVRILAVPLPLARIAGAAAQDIGRLTRRPPTLTRYRVAQLGMERTYDLSRARDALGYRPTGPTLDGASSW